PEEPHMRESCGPRGRTAAGIPHMTGGGGAGRAARGTGGSSGVGARGYRVRQMHSPLEHAHVLVTGATGFVGQAVVEKLLAAYPTTRVSILVRPRGDLSAQRRAEKLLRKPVFRSWRDSVGEENALAAFTERVTVIPGDLEDV